MATSSGMLIICCTESSTSPLLKPSHHVNTANATTLETDGARVTQDIINRIYWADQTTPLGLIIVLGHAGCTHIQPPATPETSLRTSLTTLKSNPHIRKDIQVITYMIDLYGTPPTEARLREIVVTGGNTNNSTASAAEASGQRSADQTEHLGPFWS